MSESPTPRSILIVDDEENVARALCRCLRKEGYNLHVAHGPDEALKIMAKTHIDAVLSDHLMPNITGLEFLKMVRNRYPDCLRIMLTGHADMQTAIDAINHGEIYRFLTKPWDDTELKVTLFIGFEQLDLERENRRLLATVRRQADLIKSMEKEHPGIGNVTRDADGVILIDDVSREVAA
jgi:DNA-binding NtrC family response regulator